MKKNLEFNPDKLQDFETFKEYCENEIKRYSEKIGDGELLFINQLFKQYKLANEKIEELKGEIENLEEARDSLQDEIDNKIDENQIVTPLGKIRFECENQDQQIKLEEFINNTLK